MIFCILFVLFALYKCTINVKHCNSPENDHEESQHIQRTNNQPKQLKRSYLEMTKTEERKRTKIAIKNDYEVFSNSSSAGIARNSLYVSACCQDIDLDKFEVYSLGESVHTHNNFEHSFNIDPLQLQDDKKHIPDNIMTCDNTLDDLISDICAPYDSDIQKMTAEPGFINVHNIEENTGTFLEHQSVIPQDLTAIQCDHFDTYNSVGNAFTHQQVYQDGPTISTINLDRHTYQNLDIFGNLLPSIDADELEHIFANDNCPLPSNTCSSQNTTLDIEGELDRVQDITIGGEVQNDEKTTCPATLTLSFLSFRLFQTNKSLSADQNNVIDGKRDDLDEIEGTSQPSCKEQQHNVSNFVYNCKINLDVNEINFGITGLTRNQLYTITNDRQNSDKTMYVFAKTDIDVTKYFQNLLDFLEGLDVSRYSCLNMQELYLTVIAYKCLEYNHNLKCFVLKDFLRWIHIYMSEFYFYVMLRLEKLDQGDDEAVKNKKKYKNYIKEEIRHIVTILGIYESIQQLKTKNESWKTMIGRIYCEVKQFRLHIIEFLQFCHPKEITTSVYYLAVNMRNTMSLGNSDPPKKTVQTVQKSKNTPPNRAEPAQKCSKIVYSEQKAGSKNDYSSDYRLHHLISPKKMIFILAFTLDIKKLGSLRYDLEFIKNLQKHEKYPKTPAEIFYRYIFGNTESDAILFDVVIDIIKFFEFIRSATNKNNDSKNFVQELTSLKKENKSKSYKVK